MNKPIVIDVSVAASWVMPDEQSREGQPLRDDLERRIYRPITVPLFWFEFRNILLSNERRRRILESDTLGFLATIQRIKIKVKNVDDHALVLTLARVHDLSAYDAAYLALAVKEGATLATNDKKLARAAINADVELRTALPRLQL